jgi:hypothetical protein
VVPAARQRVVGFGAFLVVLGLLAVVFNRWYTRCWLGTYVNRVRPRDMLWLRVAVLVSGMLITATGAFLITND